MRHRKCQNQAYASLHQPNTIKPITSRAQLIHAQFPRASQRRQGVLLDCPLLQSALIRFSPRLQVFDVTIKTLGRFIGAKTMARTASSLRPRRAASRRNTNRYSTDAAGASQVEPVSEPDGCVAVDDSQAGSGGLVTETHNERIPDADRSGSERLAVAPVSPVCRLATRERQDSEATPC